MGALILGPCLALGTCLERLQHRARAAVGPRALSCPPTRPSSSSSESPLVKHAGTPNAPPTCRPPAPSALRGGYPTAQSGPRAHRPPTAKARTDPHPLQCTVAQIKDCAPLESGNAPRRAVPIATRHHPHTQAAAGFKLPAHPGPALARSHRLSCALYRVGDVRDDIERGYRPLEVCTANER